MVSFLVLNKERKNRMVIKDNVVQFQGTKQGSKDHKLTYMLDNVKQSLLGTFRHMGFQKMYLPWIC